MKIFNKLSDTFEDIGTTEDNRIRIYVCGITVYDDCHIGHARTIVIFDVLRRYLRHKGKQLVYVQNFTDVDDKIINRAKSDGTSAEKISSKYIVSYFDDFSKLDIRIGTVTSAEKMEKSNKLLKLRVDDGLGGRTILSGIALHYTPEEMVGKQVTFIANLAPRKMMGIESQGMILMAEDKDGKLKLVQPTDIVLPGSTVS